MHISPRIECVGHAPRPHRAGCATHMCRDREEGRKASEGRARGTQRDGDVRQRPSLEKCASERAAEPLAPFKMRSLQPKKTFPRWTLTGYILQIRQNTASAISLR